MLPFQQQLFQSILSACSHVQCTINACLPATKIKDKICVQLSSYIFSKLRSSKRLYLHEIYLLEIASQRDYTYRAGARTLIGGGCIFIYSGYARLISFEINFITKETGRAEPEYMNIHTNISVLAPALYTYILL